MVHLKRQSNMPKVNNLLLPFNLFLPLWHCNYQVKWSNASTLKRCWMLH